MPADLRCFIDSKCTTELPLGTETLYRFLLGGSEGINGNLGKAFTTVFYVRNCGNRAALHTQIELISTEASMFSLVTTPNIGDIKEGEVTTVAIRTKVSSGTAKHLGSVVINLNYYTLPDIEENRFNPYTALREFIEGYGYEPEDYIPITEAILTVFSDATDSPITEQALDADKSGDISEEEWKAILSVLDTDFEEPSDTDEFAAMDVQKIIDSME